METALRWLADRTPASAELLRLMDATPRPVRAFGDHSETLRPGRVAGLRLLPQLFALVLGQQAPADLHPRRDRHRVLPGQPQAVRERD